MILRECDLYALEAWIGEKHIESIMEGKGFTGLHMKALAVTW